MMFSEYQSLSQATQKSRTIIKEKWKHLLRNIDKYLFISARGKRDTATQACITDAGCASMEAQYQQTCEYDCHVTKDANVS